jgi:hypothetical protein
MVKPLPKIPTLSADPSKFKFIVIKIINVSRPENLDNARDLRPVTRLADNAAGVGATG